MSATLATLGGEPLEPLDPRYRTVLRLGHALAAAVLLVPALVADAILVDQTDVGFGLVTGGVGILLVLWVLLAPARRFRSWGYRLDGDELNVASGLLFRRHAIVPMQRVQHIDLEQGPIARKFGLAELIVYTAGTHGAKVTVPGLAMSDAEGLRDAIRAHIRREGE